MVFTKLPPLGFMPCVLPSVANTSGMMTPGICWSREPKGDGFTKDPEPSAGGAGNGIPGAARFASTAAGRDGLLPLDVSYDALEAAVPEVAAMKGYDQRSDYHALTLDEHTKAALSHAKADPFIAHHPKRALILLAVMLHDIGKMSLDGHQVHKKDPSKRQYSGHEKESERMVRELLPRSFELSVEDQEFVARLVGLHASALNLLDNFHKTPEPAGRALKAYDAFIAKVEDMPGDDTIDKLRIVFAINRADKQSGVNETSDRNDPKVQDIRAKIEKQLASLDGLQKALPALVKAVAARRGGDQSAGIALVNGAYLYNKEAPKKEAKPKTEIPAALRKLGKVFREKMKPVAARYPDLCGMASQGDVSRVEAVLRDELGLNDAQVKAVTETFS